jgi:hypothetical protein
MMDGFTKNRPVPGLPKLAYEDAESVYVTWRRSAFAWNTLIKKPSLQAEELLNLLGSTFVGTVALLHDVTTALEYLIVTERAYGIPWLGSLDKCLDQIDDFRTLGLTGNLVNQRTNTILEQFASFEARFLGLPTDGANKRAPTFRTTSLGDIVTEAKLETPDNSSERSQAEDPSRSI